MVQDWNGKRALRVLGIVLLVAAVGACDLFGDDDDDEVTQNLVEVVASTDSLSSLLTVIGYIDENGSQADSADLATLLAGTGPFTVFAPNNDAFDAALGSLADPATFGPEDVTALEGVLGSAAATADALYLVVANHAASGALASGGLTNEQSITTLAGSAPNFGLTVDLTTGVQIVPSYTPSTASVVGADVPATNGVAHVIDAVLLDDTTASALGLPAD